MSKSANSLTVSTFFSLQSKGKSVYGLVHKSFRSFRCLYRSFLTVNESFERYYSWKLIIYYKYTNIVLLLLSGRVKLKTLSCKFNCRGSLYHHSNPHIVRTQENNSVGKRNHPARFSARTTFSQDIFTTTSSYMYNNLILRVRLKFSFIPNMKQFTPLFSLWWIVKIHWTVRNVSGLELSITWSNIKEQINTSDNFLVSTLATYTRWQT